MQELRLVLIIVGALAIAALLLHGLWSSRKEKPAKFGEKPLGKLDKSARDQEGFDQDGIGNVRVVNQASSEPEVSRPERKEPELHFGQKLQADPLMDSQPIASANDPLPSMTATGEPVVAPQVEAAPAAEAAQPETQTVVETPASVVEPQVSANPETTRAAETAEATLAAEVIQTARQSMEAPLQKEQVAEQLVATPAETVSASISSEFEPTLTIEDIERDQPTVSVEEMIVVEPSATLEESQVETAAAEPQLVEEEKAEPEIAAPVVEKQQEQLPPDYLVLNVHARNGDLLRGTKLFNAFEQHNLVFGENSVYHYHADVAGTGPVIFSVTNMVAPAHFPEGGNDSFETPGVAFYLMLPTQVGRADLHFKHMLQTVQQIADTLGADVLDHERALITPHRISAYREKALKYTVA
ncbi:cell division protein ZipA [Photobacterium sanctipauli]|uniref:Cell division protein ZipA n=1 Tax=Photobacterium sanctipauli TaxID=1342794 RepID=A0A2T3NTJ3_9GAMM|nr:cell division protein ZipA [Photobacterium sanctipauli]PSW19578.1 cell division protein ZipA [Photobacterium sanctipauli]